MGQFGYTAEKSRGTKRVQALNSGQKADKTRIGIGDTEFLAKAVAGNFNAVGRLSGDGGDFFAGQIQS